MYFRSRIATLILSLAFVASSFAQEALSTEIQDLLSKAKAGDAESQFRLGSAYDYGRGIGRNGKEAMKWYLASAMQGNAEAQNSVGSGLQAEKQFADAVAWYEKASTQGHALATNNLAYLYDMGLGVRQDRKKGFELYSKSADLGWAEAMWNLANMYGAGQVGKPDLFMACVWIARAQKFVETREDRLVAHLKRAMPQLESLLTSDQLSECKQQSESWIPALKANR